MIHIFFLVMNLATSGMIIGESNETYDTMEACKAAIDTRVVEANKEINPHNLMIVEAKCDTEENMKKSLEQSKGFGV